MNIDEIIKLIKQNNEKANSKIIFYVCSYPDVISNIRILNAALNAKNHKIFDFLLDQGSPLLRADTNKLTTAYYAAKTANNEFLEKILTILSDVDQKKIFGNHDVSRAAINTKNLDTIKILVKYNYKFSSNSLHYAVSTGNLDIIKYFVEDLKFDIENKNKLGDTPLQHGLHFSNFEVIDYLIYKGANINTINNKKQNILYTLMNPPEAIDSFFDQAGDFSSIIKLGFKFFERIIFEKLWQNHQTLIKIPEKFKSEVKNHIKQIIEYKQSHIEIDRDIKLKLKNLHIANNANNQIEISNMNAELKKIIEEMTIKCKIKLYRNSEVEINNKSKISSDKESHDNVPSLKCLTAIQAVKNPELRDKLFTEETVVIQDLETYVAAVSVLGYLLEGDSIEISY